MTFGGKLLNLAWRGALALGLVYLLAVEAVNLFLRHRFAMELDGDVFLIVASSGPDEIGTFFRLYAGTLAGLGLVFTLIAALVVILACRLRRRGLAAFTTVALAVAAAGIVSAGSLRAWKPLYFAYDTLRSAAGYRELLAAGRWTGERDAQIETAPPDAENLLFIIGESATADHLSAYGYAHATSPRLADGRAAVLGPLTATHPDTARALVAMLSDDRSTLAADYRLHGYRTALFSAQNRWERYSAVEQLVFHACETKRYLSDEKPSRRHYDGELVPLVRAEIARDDPRPFAIFAHLLGSHFDPAERVPDDFTAPTDFSAYDRSLAYTDEVVAALAALAPTNTLVVYVADHGESPDSPAGWRQHDSPSLYRVPFAVWPAAAARRFAGLSRTDELLPRLRPAWLTRTP